MKLDKYWKVLDLLDQGKTDEEIQHETSVSVSLIKMMRDGARIAPHILLQMKDGYERCPRCGCKTLLPCLTCYMETHPYADCIEVITRPVRNQDMTLSVLLDSQLLEGLDEDDEEIDDEL